MRLTHWKLANSYVTNFQSDQSIQNAKDHRILHQQGHSQREISKKTGYSICGIQAVIKTFEESGEVKDKKRPRLEDQKKFQNMSFSEFRL